MTTLMNEEVERRVALGQNRAGAWQDVWEEWERSQDAARPLPHETAEGRMWRLSKMRQWEESAAATSRLSK